MRRERSRHTQVGDDDASAGVTGQHIDRGAAPQQVLDHLRGHDLGIRAHALLHDTVITGEGEDDGKCDRGWALPGDLGEAARQLLEAPEAARWLGELVEATLSLAARRSVRRVDQIKELRERAHEKSETVKVECP
jgi:hypothetical protein